MIILNYNTKKLLRKNLQALKKALSDLEYRVEIIVVDNGSTDNSIDMVKREFPEVKLISLNQNLGYSRGNNEGIKKSFGNYILLLNSDAIVAQDTLAVMIKFMEDHPDVGVATCKLVFPDGSFDPACHRGFPTPWAAFTYFSGLEKIFPHRAFFSGYHLGHLSLETIHEIDSPSGAFYLVRREVIEQIGLLDEDYFMYGEDLDWSYRIKKAGWKIMYVPKTQVVHYKKQSGRASENRQARRKATKAFYDTMKIFYQKHYKDKYPAALRWLIFFFIDILKKLSVVRN